MYEFRNIVLSRKGFDSSSGYGYSPFDPTTGKYITIPIPGSKGEQAIANKNKYEDIQIRPDYLAGICATNLKELLFLDVLRYGTRTKREISCDFCSIHAFYGNNTRQRPIHQVVEEIEQLERKHVLFSLFLVLEANQ